MNHRDKEKRTRGVKNSDMYISEKHVSKQAIFDTVPSNPIESDRIQLAGKKQKHDRICGTSKGREMDICEST